MLERYHAYVDAKRTSLLEEMGINLADPNAEPPGTPPPSIHDTIRQSAVRDNNKRFDWSGWGIFQIHATVIGR
eukprot:1657018-Pyramimonas_sp.AAC.1